MGVKLIHGDIADYLADYREQIQRGEALPYTAVLGDPPYYLGSIVERFGDEDSAPAQEGADGRFQRLSAGFMGQTWDGFKSPYEYQKWVTQWGKLLLDCVYPGAILMMFGGSRTYHRLATGLEDSGWILFDCAWAWVYGSGFPKSLDISKAIDKEAGAAREVLPIEHPSKSRAGKVSNAGIGVTNLGNKLEVTAPATPDSALWSGYGTALKPSYEPIVIARAPRGKLTYAQCAVRFGTGAFNIDGTRLPAGKEYQEAGFGARYSAGAMPQMGGHQSRQWVEERIEQGLPVKESQPNDAGRWLPNTLLTCHPDCTPDAHVDGCHIKEMGDQSGEVKAGGSTPPGAYHTNSPTDFKQGVKSRNEFESYDDTGTAARFFYNSKATTWEREAGLEHLPLTKGGIGEQRPSGDFDQRLGKADEPIMRHNIHPTVKPIRLIEQLARLILPPQGVEARLLVPFAGVASEVIAARLAGWQDITGVEMTADYIPLAQARLKWWRKFDSYEMANDYYKTRNESGQKTLFEAMRDLEQGVEGDEQK